MLAFAAFGLCFAMIIALPPARALALRAFATGVSPLRGLGAGGGSAVVPVEAASAPRVRRDRRRRAPGAEMSTRRRAADAVAGAEKRDHFKRKVALYVCYDGSAYAGLQKNEGVSTVGDVLETALFRAGAIRESNFGDLGKVGWTVSARTDKGVSAASNVVAFKAAFPRKGDESDDMAAKEIDFSTLVAAVNKELPPDVRVLGAAKPTSSFSAKDACAGRRYEYLLPCEALAGGSGELSKLATILRQYEGTHSYHNFTVGKEHRIPPPPPATRFITLCTCKEKPVVIQSDDGVQKEFARILVQGQSFMLHQIRKMVSLAVLIERGAVPRSSIEDALNRKLLGNIPPAPASGLFLDCLHFTAYNKRFADHLERPIELDSCEDLREAFKRDHIYPSILRRAIEEDTLEIFFSTVANHVPTFVEPEAQ